MAQGWDQQLIVLSKENLVTVNDFKVWFKEYCKIKIPCKILKVAISTTNLQISVEFQSQ